jgi:hypothetical protein
LIRALAPLYEAEMEAGMIHTLRGLLAVEQGDRARALAAFQKCLELTGFLQTPSGDRLRLGAREISKEMLETMR